MNADYMTATENEVRIETRDKHGPIRQLVQKVYKQLGCQRMIVTRGSSGCLCCDPVEGLVNIPAVAGKVVDRIGAGPARSEDEQERGGREESKHEGHQARGVPSLYDRFGTPRDVSHR
jgi:hypothetical protein